VWKSSFISWGKSRQCQSLNHPFAANPLHTDKPRLCPIRARAACVTSNRSEHCCLSQRALAGKMSPGIKLESEYLGRVYVIGEAGHQGALGNPGCRKATGDREPGSQCLSTPRAQVVHSFTASNKRFFPGTTLAFPSILTLQLIPWAALQSTV